MISKLKHFKSQISRKLLKIWSLLFVLLGFSISVVAQYGAPMAHYQINGKIINGETGEALKDIKLTLEKEYYNKPYFQTIPVDSNGQFGIFQFVRWGEKLDFKLVANDTIDDGIDFKPVTSKYVFDFERNHRNQQIDSPIVIKMYPVQHIDEQKVKKPLLSILDLNRFELPDVDYDSLVIDTSFKINEIISFDSISFVELGNDPDIDWNIFPNPTIDKVSVVFPFHEKGNMVLFIYSQDGKLLHQEMVNQSENQKVYDLSQFVGSSYIFVLKHQEEFFYKKIIRL